MERVLIFCGAAAGDRDLWAWLVEIARGLQSARTRVELVLTEARGLGSREPLRRSYHAGLPVAWLPRLPELHDPTLESSAGYQDALDDLLAAEGDRNTVAIVCGLHGHATSLFGSLRIAGIPHLAFFPDLWPMCARGDLVIPPGEPCPKPEVDRCVRCSTLRWPELRHVAPARITGQLQRARLDLQVPDLLWLPAPRGLDALRALGVSRSRVMVRPALPIGPASPAARCGPEREVHVVCVAARGPGSGVADALAAKRLLGPGYRWTLAAPDARQRRRWRRELRALFAVEVASQEDLEPDSADVLLVPDFALRAAPPRFVRRVTRAVPIVCARDSCLAPSIVEGCTGYTYRTGDPADLARAIVAARNLVQVPWPAPEPEPPSRWLAGILARLPLPEGAPSGISYWDRSLSLRVLVTAPPRRSRVRRLYPLRYRDGVWVPAGAVREVNDPGALDRVLTALLGSG